MAPKRQVKPKKEEAVEIPKTSTLPDGARVHFIGGWSSSTSLGSINAITIDRSSGEKILILPGVYDSGATTLTVRTLSIEGVSLADLSERHSPKLAEAEGDAEAVADADAVPVVEAESAVDRSVTIKGAITFEAWIPPVEIKAPTPPPVEEKKEVKPKPGGKEKKKAVVIEEEAPPPVAVAETAPAVGVNPASWPTVTLRKICFCGPVVTKGVHLTLVDCHFTGAPASHQLAVHQYCNVSLKRCTFSSTTKSCIYAFPLAQVEALDCVFSGADVLLQQEAAKQTADAAAVAAASASELAAKGCSSSVGVFVDDAVVRVEKCKFRQLFLGAMIHDKASQTQIVKCEFDRIFSVGCFLDGAHCAVKGNAFRRCEYYALRAHGRTAAKVLNNDFQSQVYIEKGAAPVLFGNTCALRLIDENEAGNVYMEAAY